MFLLTPSGLHYTRCPLSCPVRVGVWLWVWAWACVVQSAGQGVSAGQGAILQDFPIAAEENFYSFNPDGTYTFSYDTGGGEHQSFRIEMRDASGRVSGRYGYVDPAGALRITEYQADSSGYRASIEVYHQVSLAPPTPLLVGPIPKQPASTPDSRESPSQPPAMRPVGPAPFFPAQQPVLIIGPLPKPLQPQSNELDQDPPDMDEDSLFTIQSDPLVPAVFPKSPLGDVPSRVTLNSPQGAEGLSTLQGTLTGVLQQSSDETLTDILQESSEDFEVTPNSTATDLLQVSYNDIKVPQNNTVTASSTPTENTNQQRESMEAAVGDDGQTGASSNAEADQQLPEDLQQLPIQNSSPVTQLEHKEINPTTTKSEKTNVVNVAGVTVNPAQENSVSDGVSEEPNYSIIRELLQPSATTITTSTTSRLAERGVNTETSTPITTSPVLAAKEDDDTSSQLRTFRHHPSVPPTLPRTYLPVGVPRHQYPAAPLLQLPQESNSYLQESSEMWH